MNLRNDLTERPINYESIKNILDSCVLLRHSAVHLQRFTSNVPSYGDVPIMAEEDLRFAYTAARPCSCSAAHRGRRLGDDGDVL